MAKDSKTTIEFEYEGKTYKLEFTASSIKKMERQGFKFGKMDEIALTAVEELFSGAFIANHENVTRRKRREIFEALCEPSESGDAIGEVLGDMLSEAIEELNTHQGNVKWSVLK